MTADRSETITLEYLRSILHYDEKTGIFTWIKSLNNRGAAGKAAGYTAQDGRRRIMIAGTNYLASRLAWFYVKGVWPKFEIDHKDTNTSNDAIDNLRDVPRGINQQNLRHALATNKLGVQGVCFSKGKYQASIQLNGVRKHLGCFDTVNEAHTAYIAAKRTLHEGNTL